MKIFWKAMRWHKTRVVHHHSWEANACRLMALSSFYVFWSIAYVGEWCCKRCWNRPLDNERCWNRSSLMFDALLWKLMLCCENWCFVVKIDALLWKLMLCCENWCYKLERVSCLLGKSQKIKREILKFIFCEDNKLKLYSYFYLIPYW
jgi:hypothetical protein